MANGIADVCIVGSGAGGGTLAKELCLKGIKVVVLEAGPRLDPVKDFVNDEFTMYGKLTWTDPRTIGGRDAVPGAFWTVKAVGGTTVHWAGICPRFTEDEFKTKSYEGSVPGTTLEDWPISLDEMLPYYKKAEAAMGIAGEDRPNPPIPMTTNTLILGRGAAKLGYKAEPSFMAINTQKYDGRDMCRQCGFCFQGCMVKAKWSTLYEAIPKAEATGNLDLRPNCFAVRINLDRRDKVSGVTYVDELGNYQEQKARIVAVAGNSMETARLLLLSDSAAFPSGLANSSGQVGRNYMVHTTGSAIAIFPKPIQAYKGATMSGIVNDFRNSDPKRGHIRGIFIETLFVGAPVMALAGVPGIWGAELKELMDNYENLAMVWLCGEDMPQAGNQITLDPEVKDKNGVPVAKLTYNMHENDRRMQQFIYQKTKEIYEAAGATKVYLRPPFPAGHNMGSCRMGDDPAASVVNKFGQSHDIKNLFVSDGSVFTSSAAPNPTVTIVSLAIRQADYLAEEMKKGNI